MAPQRHRYTKCVLFTGQRANKSNERVVCKYCSEAESPQWALQHALLCNTKKLVKSHLRRCRHFHAAQASGQDEPIVFTEDEDDGAGAARAAKRKNYLPESAAKRLKSDDTSRAQALTKLTRQSDDELLERLLLNATLANGWAFTWVDQRASAQLLQHLHSYVRLPPSDVLAGRILQTAGEKEAEHVWNAVEKERIGCTMVLDGWRSVENARVLGILLTTSQGEVLVWHSKDVKDKSESADIDVGWLQEFVAAHLSALESSTVQVVAVIADSSKRYAQARRSLRRARRDLMVLPCVAHQLNAFISDLFKIVPKFHETLLKTFDVATGIHRARGFKEALHKKQLEVNAPGETILVLPSLPSRLEWESLRHLTVNLLTLKDHLKALVDQKNATADIPNDVLASLRNEEGFWLPLLDLDSILYRVARWIAIIKLHQGRLHYIPIVKHSIASALEQQLAPEVGSPLLERLEARWDEWEHPLMVLAVVLNPAFGWSFIDNSSGVTLMRLSCWARYYYECFFNTKPHNLPNELLEYVEGDKFWCSPASIGSFAAPLQRPMTNEKSMHDDADLLARLSFKVVQYWKSCSTDCPELSKLALRIFAVAVTSASTDGLFSPPTALADATFERLNPQQQLAAVRVRARTKYEQRHDAVAPERGVGPFSMSTPRENGGDDSASLSNEVVARQREIDQAKLHKLLARWDDQHVLDVDEGVERETPNNENEAINSMYAKIHPADDKFSKYSIQTLFQSR